MDQSEGGSRIYDHRSEDANVTIEVARPPDGWREAIEAHLDAHFGACANVFHELVSTNVHLDVYMYSPSGDRPYVTLVTVGCSDAPLTVPDGADDFRFVELVLYLPPDWPLPDGSEIDERHYWPIRTLKTVARLPHIYGSFLAYGHTIPNGDPPETYADNTEFTCALLTEPVFEQESFHRMDALDRRLTFLQLIPITPAETDIKLNAGHDVLMGLLMNDVDLQPALDNDRACASAFYDDAPDLEALCKLYGDTLKSTRETFKRGRNQLGFFARRRFKAKPPIWLRLSGGSMMDTYRKAELFRTEGQVVWGHIVQANQLLFDPTSGADCPAAIIYSLDPYYEGNVPELARISEMLFEVKGETTTDELQRFADLLEDETEIQMKLPIPKSLTGGRDVYYTSIMVHRKHLVFPFLASSAFPLMVLPRHTEATKILPVDFWSDDMKGLWAAELQNLIGEE